MRAKILNLKKKIKKSFGNQPYLSHLPHCTLFTINASNKLLKERKKFKYISINSNYHRHILIKKTGLFSKDPITGGKTIYFRVERTPFLNLLQRKLLKNFSKFIIPNKAKFKLKWMKTNNKKFGYPFVGNKWIPHLTLASLMNLDKKNEFFKNFLRKKIKHKEIHNKIYVYKVKNDKHQFLWSINILKK